MKTEDVPAVCNFWYSLSDLDISPSFDSVERITEYLQRNPGLSTVARRGERIMGAVMCGHDGRRGSLYHLGVLPENRRQGIGKRLTERSLAALREIGITTAFLFTHEKNQQAQAFWKQAGWQYCSWIQYHCCEFKAHPANL